ncbi:MAG: hypothetical protein IKU31_04315, partial [Oscillospiraceae bacterium]|nr:hypothetical protein [Oscillospiraceae bacterium]
QPGDDDRGVQTAGVGEDDLLDVFLVHGGFLRVVKYLCTDYNQILYICQYQCINIHAMHKETTFCL